MLSKRLSNPDLMAGVPVQQMAEDGFPSEAQLDELGREIPDPTPMAPPIGWTDPPSLEELIRSFVRNEHVKIQLQEQGAETFAESEDFDVDDDLEPDSPYEGNFDRLTESPEEALQRLQDAEKPPAAPPGPPAAPAAVEPAEQS